ncbi:MAG: MATE family efflux transporter [Nitrospirota bacterium]
MKTIRANLVDLTSGNLWSNIWRISWPIFLIMVFNSFVGLTDVYVAGLISPDVQAAVGFIGQIYFLIIIIANAISIGVVALVSRSIGAGDYERAAEAGKQSLISSVGVATILTVGGLIFSKEIVAATGFPIRIRDISEHFLRIFTLALGPNYILIISTALFRASGEVKKPLVTMFAVSLINIIGDFALVFGIFPFPRMGYAGIAVATAASMIAGMIINLFFFYSSTWQAIYKGTWTPVPDLLRKIISIGWPAALLQVAWNAGTIVLYNILGKVGDKSIVAIASITNGLRIEAFIYLPAFAMNMAAAVLIGQNLGAGNPDRAAQVGWKIAFSGALFISSVALVVFIWAVECASLLTTNAAVLEETTRYLRINMVSEPFMAMSAILAGGLQGAGDTRGTMWVIVIAMWLIRLPLAYFLALVAGYGAVGVWYAMITSMIVQGILMTWRFRQGRWKTLKV